MKIALINGSPKFRNSASEIALNMMKEYLPAEQFEEYVFNKSQIEEEQLISVLQNDSLLFAFPLYVDGIPSQLFRCLMQIDEYVKTHPIAHSIMVYAVVNNGFFEGKQNTPALEEIRNWSKCCGFTFGQGIGIGGGGMLGYLQTIKGENGPKKSVALLMKEMCENILKKQSAPMKFAEPDYPAEEYKKSAEEGWRTQVQKNGLTIADLDRKLEWREQ